jgi:hypothetical protein
MKANKNAHMPVIRLVLEGGKGEEIKGGATWKIQMPKSEMKRRHKQERMAKFPVRSRSIHTMHSHNNGYPCDRMAVLET